MIGNKSINIKNYLSTIASPSFKKILALLLVTFICFFKHSRLPNRCASLGFRLTHDEVLDTW